MSNPTTPHKSEGEVDHSDAFAKNEAFVRGNLVRNYIGHFLHGVFGMTGFRLISTPTFVPSYLYSVSGSELWVGVGSSLQQLGAVVSPILGAAFIEHRLRVLRIAAWLGMAMRLPLLGLAFAAWLLTGIPELTAALILLFLFGIFSGPQRVAFQLLLAKVIPLAARGRLQAWRNLVGGIIAAAVSYFAGSWLIANEVLGNGYGTTFFLAFCLTSLGLLAIQLILREPEAYAVRERTQLSQRFRELPSLVMSDSDFAWFILARSLAIGTRIGLPFLFLYATQALELSVAEGASDFGATIAVLSLAFMGAETFANLLWGYLSDRTGFRLAFVLSLILNIIGMSLFLISDSYTALVIGFALVGAAQAGYLMASFNLVLELGSLEDTSMRLALISTAENVMGVVTPLLGAALTVWVGYEGNFLVTIGFLIMSLFVLMLKVKEPRRRTSHSVK